MGFQTTFFIFYSGLTLNQDGVTSPCPDLKLIHYIKVKMDEAAYLVMPYFVLPKIGYC